MRMIIARIGPRTRLMNARIHGTPILIGELTRKCSDELGALRRGQLRRDEDKPFPSETGIAAKPRVLGGVPQGRAILGPRHIGTAGEIRRQHDFLVGNVAPMGIIMGLTRPRIEDALARAIGGGICDATTLASRDMPGTKKIYRHPA